MFYFQAISHNTIHENKRILVLVLPTKQIQTYFTNYRCILSHFYYISAASYRLVGAGMLIETTG